MRKGIKATATRDIALRAGISEGAIYRHFEIKEGARRAFVREQLDYFGNS